MFPVLSWSFLGLLVTQRITKTTGFEDFSIKRDQENKFRYSMTMT